MFHSDFNQDRGLALLLSEEVVSWFEDNAGETDIPAEVAALKKVGEEDNPVVVMME